ncbi:triose-phosphate isomerase, partial [Patescibacteria group bacterium]|nr:triose-phosphate isomerase [Patescibacteria group bacterium]
HERDESHEYLNFIKTQIEECLKGIVKSFLPKIIIAYEPVWAIGRNAVREATPKEFLEISIFIRKILSDKFGAKAIGKTMVIYGGSVNPKNTADFLKEGETDGFLVGRDSLDPEKFGEIINITENI